mmetsp:Transcript_18306/g.62173  ORF Transcript_18306/g.62173 Transcript_18306/m.62173 type:complete len:289 (-) Transcript_18306:188-1054(-)
MWSPGEKRLLRKMTSPPMSDCTNGLAAKETAMALTPATASMACSETLKICSVTSAHTTTMARSRARSMRKLIPANRSHSPVSLPLSARKCLASGPASGESLSSSSEGLLARMAKAPRLRTTNVRSTLLVMSKSSFSTSLPVRVVPAGAIHARKNGTWNTWRSGTTASHSTLTRTYVTLARDTSARTEVSSLAVAARCWLAPRYLTRDLSLSSMKRPTAKDMPRAYSAAPMRRETGAYTISSAAGTDFSASCCTSVSSGAFTTKHAHMTATPTAETRARSTAARKGEGM